MDYEQKYNEALGWMRQLYLCLYGQFRENAERFFPELKESGDEWFIKELQGFLESYGADYFGTHEWQKFHAWLENQKEQKPILEVFGFKVGDAVRLKDGDGRKHIIKSFEEVEGLHGPNFYHVEFEDNSAKSGIYPGEEYPNGYYTQMEKFEEEQEPLSTEETELNSITFLEQLGYTCVPPGAEQKPADDEAKAIAYREYERGRESGLRDGQKYVLDNAESYGLCKPAEWSEEDEIRKESCMLYLANTRDVIEFSQHIGDNARKSGKNEIQKDIDWLKSLRPSWKPSRGQPDTDLEKAARHVYESWIGGTMDDVRRDIVELGRVINARKEESK